MGTRTLILAIALVALGLVASTATLLSLRDEPVPGPLTPDPGFEALRIPDFQLIDQDSRPVDASVFDGKVTILSFFFSHCITVCPALQGKVAELYGELDGTKVQFVSISVDPEHDTPEAMREYAERMGADGKRWRFLTGDRATIERIVMEGVQFEVGEDTSPDGRIELPGGGEMANIMHPSRLFLIGPDRVVLGTSGYRFQQEVDAFTKRAAAAARKAR
ncbi:MAG: SCO family protein [Phycisphaerales bacterium]|jgi:protein SCO1/2|nr:SCO family protein [Phycisphaerales bacterium]